MDQFYVGISNVSPKEAAKVDKQYKIYPFMINYI